jgi:PAS domain S-box/PAS domain S-box/PAS domain S-box
MALFYNASCGISIPDSEKSNMDVREKSREDLIKELQKLQKEYDALKKSYLKDINHYKQTKQKLQKSEEKWRKLVTTIPDYIALHDLMGNYIFLNHYAKGFSEKDVIGKSVFDFISEDSKEEFHLNFDACLKTKQTQRFIYSAFGNNKVLRLYESYLIPILEKDLIVSVMAFAVDITESKQSEMALKQAIEWQQKIFEGSLDAIFISDADSCLIAVNNAACDLTGYSKKQLLKMKIPDLHDVQDLNAYRKYHNIIFKGEQILSEAKILRRDGIKIDTEFNNSRISISGKLYMHTTARDITERKCAEAALKESEARFRSLFDNSLMGISVTSTEGRLLQVNLSYARMYGYETPEIMLAEVTDVGMLFVNPEKREKILRMLSRKGYMEAQEIEVIRREGSHFFVLTSASEIRDVQGKLLYNLATHIDLTERKKMEVELRKSNKLLEKLNQHLLDVRENERNQIALNLHDDLGQKLTAINLDIAWLKSRIGVQSKSVREKFEEMSSMIKETVESIRETSSLLRPAILFDLGIVAAIKSRLGSFEKQTGIKCHFYFEPEEFDLEDRLALILYRILQESLTNIARHSGASATEIELVILKNKIEMIIEDNGKGIAKDKVNSLESMGIAGMKERVKSANGKIIIRGETGAGTRIKVIIPLIKEKVDD